MSKERGRNQLDLSVRPPEMISQELTTDVKDVPQSYQEETFQLDKKRDQEIRKLQLENDRLQVENEKITGDNRLRKILAGFIFFTVFIWLASVVYILCKVNYPNKYRLIALQRNNYFAIAIRP